MIIIQNTVIFADQSSVYLLGGLLPTFRGFLSYRDVSVWLQYEISLARQSRPNSLQIQCPLLVYMSSFSVYETRELYEQV